MQDLIQNMTKASRAGCVAQVVDHLPDKCKALSQTPVLPKEKEKKSVMHKRYRENTISQSNFIPCQGAINF
jgi:hypothetical protein